MKHITEMTIRNEMLKNQVGAVVVFSAQQFNLINPRVWVSFVKKSEVLVTEQAIDVETSDPKS